MLKLILGFFSILLISSCSSKQEDGSLNNYLDKYIQAHVANGRFNGNILVVKKDSVLLEKSYGFADVAGTTLIEKQDQFLIGSVTKPFTAAAILRLVQKNKLSLNQPVGELLPELNFKDTITIHQLLSHSSGVKDYHVLANWREMSKQETNANLLIDTMLTYGLDFRPGTNFKYSNMGYIILSQVIEKVAKISYSEFLLKEVIRPLDLKNTGVALTNQDDNLVAGRSSNPIKTSEADFIHLSQPFGSGNMYSTCQDLVKFIKAIVNTDFIKEPLKSEMLKAQVGSYGYGWGIRDFSGNTGIGHRGGMNGFLSSLTYLPKQELAICILTNDENTAISTINENIVAIINGDKVTNPEKEKYNIPKSSTISAVIGRYLIKESDTLQVYFNEVSLYVKETGQEKQELFYIGNNRFVFQKLEAKITFEDLVEGKFQELRIGDNPGMQAERIKYN